MKKTAIFLLLGALAFGSVSCDKYLDVNRNTDTPEDVAPHLRLAPIIASFEGIYYDMRAIAPLSQFMGSSYYSSFATHSYSAASDAGGEQWRMLYWLQGANNDSMINRSLREGRYRLAGIGLTIKAFTWDLTTKQVGDMPLHDAFVFGLLSHRYDTQEENYKYVRKWAYEAIKYFEMTDATDYGNTLTSTDYIYQGDAVKWKKFAYAVLARNYASLSNKKDFISAGYADSVIYCANNSFTSIDDNAEAKVDAVGTFQFNGVRRGNMSGSTVGAIGYFQRDYLVQILTGSVPKYDLDGSIISDNAGNVPLTPFIIADTIGVATSVGHYDPRAAVLLANNTPKPADPRDVRFFKFGQGRATNANNATNHFGLSVIATAANAGIGRWLFRDNTPNMLTTYAEVQFCKAEAAWKKGNTAIAYDAFKKGVQASMDFTQKYIYIPTDGIGGDKITSAAFKAFADEYVAGPYVNGLGEANLTLSHIMMQKFVSLYPYSPEAWVDLRKYHYDLVLGPEGVPVAGTSWTTDFVYHKAETDPERIYKGFYLPAANVVNQRAKFPIANEGSPAYRLRPRYNSEYMWNLPSLAALTPIPGTSPKYHTSIVWFAIP